MTSAGDPRIDHYDWSGGREAMLRFGPDRGPTTVVALPLLEEANRTRALVIGMLRALAAHGIAGALPELPATGESVAPTEAMRLPALRAAFAAAARTCDLPLFLGIRSGALVTAGTPNPSRGDAGCWQLSPQTGPEVVREWRRLRAGDKATVAGNRIADQLWTDLADATPPPGRVVRLAGDPRPADRVVDAPPPWRRAEPEADLALAALLADDVVEWIATCAG